MKARGIDYIPTHRKKYYHQIIDNQTNIHYIALRLYFLDDHFPPNKLDAALKWLISHKLVGGAFIEWFRLQCNNSDLTMHHSLLQVVNNAAPESIIMGRNFK